MTKDAFSQVLESEWYTFSDAEKESVLRNWAEKSDPDVNLDPVVNCPVCKSATEKNLSQTTARWSWTFAMNMASG